MKNLLAVIIVITLLFSFTSCKKEKPSRIITTQNPSESIGINDKTSKNEDITQAGEPSSKENEPSKE